MGVKGGVIAPRGGGTWGRRRAGVGGQFGPERWVGRWGEGAGRWGEGLGGRGGEEGTLSGIHMTLVVGYGWSNVAVSLNTPVVSFS